MKELRFQIVNDYPILLSIDITIRNINLVNAILISNHRFNYGSYEYCNHECY